LPFASTCPSTRTTTWSARRSADQNKEHQGGERAKDGTHPPVLHDQGDKRAQEQQEIAEQLDHELGKEGDKLGHVAVDALDQLSGAALVVEAHIETQAVAGQFVA
jgi:hypothetical protein